MPRTFFPVGIRYMAASAFFFSLMSVFVKLAGERLPTLMIVLARGLVLVVITWGLLRHAGIWPWGNRRGLLILRGVLGLIALTCFYYALVHLPLADATVIQYTNPVWTALLAALFLDERLQRAEVVGTAASLTGVVLIARPTLLFESAAEAADRAVALDPLFVGVALAGAVFSAAAYVTVRKLGATEDPLVIVFYFALVNAVAAIPATVPVAVWPTPWEWLLLLGVGLSTQVAQVYMTKGLRRERAGRAMSIAYLQIVFAALWGALVFDEIPDLWIVTGAVLVMGGTWLAGRGSRSGGRREEELAGPA